MVPPRKLLVIFDNLELSGTHRVALNLMDAAFKSGIDCQALVCMSDKIGMSDHDSRIHWPNQKYGTSESLFTKIRKAIAALKQSVRLAQEADIILAVCPPSAVIAWWAGLHSGTPVIGWVHYDVAGRQREPTGATSNMFRDWIQNFLYYRFMPRLKNIAFVSATTTVSMAQGSGKKDIPKNWQALPNIYQQASFTEQSVTAHRLPLIKKTGQPIILFLGRLARQKRWEDSLQAAIELDSLGVKAQWVFLGDGPEQVQFLKAIAASPVKERLHWFGSDCNPLPVFAQADALVLTSLYEAWPTVIMEAFDLGISVVSYACPSGPAEMLGQQERGWLTAEDPKSIALALAERFSPSGIAEAAHRNEAARIFLERFYPETAMKVWLAYFEAVMAEQSRIKEFVK